MRKIATTAFLGMLAITTTGCPSSNTSQSISPAPSPSTVPVVVQTPPPVKPPLIAQNPSSAAYLAPGLIQPTNANQRTKQVAKGNRDPFTALFLPIPAPPVSAGNNSNSAAPSPGGGSPIVRGTTNRQSRPNLVTTNTNNSNRANTNSRTVLNQRGLSSRAGTPTQNIPLPPNTTLPNNNLEPALPPALPEPDLAKSVMVMGVVQIGEQTQAIVQVPNESTSRYVQVGQRLSNGQVLVKRIDLNAGAEPLVILEQYGVEVSKAVGEQAPSQEPQATSPTAAVPYLPSSPSSTTSTAELPSPPPSSTTSTAELPSPPLNINTPEQNIVLPALFSNAPVAANKDEQSK